MSEQNIINLETAILANGCFWCTEAVFQQLKGVEDVVSGYTGGQIKNPAYREICTGRTGHAEGIKITFNSSIISFEELLEVFFATHDPTTLNRQGHDRGTQYRSEIFYTSEAQKIAATKFIEFLENERVFKSPIVTAVSEAKPFYTAEEDHQDFYKNNQQQPYCQFIINPKLDKIKKYYGDKLKEKKA